MFTLSLIYRYVNLFIELTVPSNRTQANALEKTSRLFLHAWTRRIFTVWYKFYKGRTTNGVKLHILNLSMAWPFMNMYFHVKLLYFIKCCHNLYSDCRQPKRCKSYHQTNFFFHLQRRISLHISLVIWLFPLFCTHLTKSWNK